MLKKLFKEVKDMLKVREVPKVPHPALGSKTVF